MYHNLGVKSKWTIGGKEMKNSFIVYYQYAEHFELLTDEELGRLIRAMLLYDRDGTLPCLLYTSPSPRDRQKSRMPSSA